MRSQNSVGRLLSQCTVVEALVDGAFEVSFLGR